ncbi:hypothetical protein EVAR_47585_1 [Eumeta japonica]|uniref:Uncharacterized protein n=1 Tax=Eumeta variegata TaxID=151549 RepID=A0A4C1WQ01_EUMVA|nr:hypothetical protein EVAR_47585_1 [Eumeta japonica]
MINRDNWGIRIATLEVKFLDRRKTNISKAFAKGVFINQERKLEVRRRLDTALVLTVNMSSSDPPTLTQRLGGQLPETKDFGLRGEYVGGAICLVNSGNERDSSLLNRRRHSGVRGVRVARLTGGVIKIFLEGPAASSRTRLSNNRSVMPLDVLGRTRYTEGISMFSLA